MTSAEMLQAARFAMSVPGKGYDTREVDAFLESAAATLGNYERGVPTAGHAQPVMRASEVEALSFSYHPERPGYDPAAVDQVVKQVADALAEWESQHQEAKLAADENETAGLSGRELLDALAYARAVRPGGLNAQADMVQVLSPQGQVYVVESVRRSDDGIIVTLK